jgi:hypothetical protein
MQQMNKRLFRQLSNLFKQTDEDENSEEITTNLRMFEGSFSDSVNFIYDLSDDADLSILEYEAAKVLEEKIPDALQRFYNSVEKLGNPEIDEEEKKKIGENAHNYLYKCFGFKYILNLMVGKHKEKIEELVKEGNVPDILNS